MSKFDLYRPSTDIDFDSIALPDATVDELAEATREASIEASEHLKSLVEVALDFQAHAKRETELKKPDRLVAAWTLLLAAVAAAVALADTVLDRIIPG